MAISPLTIALIVIFFSIVLVRRLRPALDVPYATSTIPIVGPAVQFGKNPIKYLAEQRKLHGDIFCLDLIATRITFFISPAGNALFTRKSEAELSMFKMLQSRLGQRIIEGCNFKNDWLNVSVRLMYGAFNDAAILKEWDGLLSSHISLTLKQWSERPEIDLFSSMSMLTLSSITIALLGKDFSNKYGPEVSKLCQLYERAIQDPLLGVFPQWATSAGRQLWRIEARIDELVAAEIERRRILVETKGPEVGFASPDYLSYILKTEGFWCAPILGNHLQGMWLGAHTNQSATISWMVVHALSTPEIYEQIQKEHATITPQPGSFPPFLQACFREVGRLYTNMMMLRKVDTKAFQFPSSRYILPINETIGIAPLVICRDTTIYGPTAGLFYPERFSDTAKITAHVKKHELMTWGGGVHACKGEKFAKNFVFNNFWGRFLGEGYKFEPVSGIKIFEQEAGDVLKSGRREAEAHGITPTWATENLGTPFVTAPVKLRVIKA